MRWGDIVNLAVLVVAVSVITVVVTAPRPSSCTTTIEKTNTERAPYG